MFRLLHSVCCLIRCVCFIFCSTNLHRWRLPICLEHVSLPIPNYRTFQPVHLRVTTSDSLEGNACRDG
uniref:Putative secreted protein n=1 Tax=Anopheles darlingi TaxID=43151 RepID=A0A2M4DGH0_ANODA